jgi:hypothetical protein
MRCSIHKFAEADGVLNERDNIVVMVDEAHRTQEGDLGRKMRDSLPNAFLFGLTGTPINRADRNTFYAFGAEEDGNGYMSRYGLDDSLRDGATKPLHFEPRLVNLHIDKKAIAEAFKELTARLTDNDRDKLGKAAAKMAVLVKAPARLAAICADIAQHFQEKVAPNGFGAQVVTFDRESCVLYKKELDKHLPPEVSDIVMSVNSGEKEYEVYKRDRDAEEKLLDRFRDPKDPLKILIVTSKLLTGFDAPILQTMYLDKPLRDHTLLQAICRVNRPYSEEKTHGLIVDYLGIFDDVAQALQFDEKGVLKAVSNIAELVDKLPVAMQKCLTYFAGCDRRLQGYEGLIAAQEYLPNNKMRDAFAADFSVLSKIWEALSPDAAMISTMTFERAEQIHSEFLKSVGEDSTEARSRMLAFLGWDEPLEDGFAQDVRILLVSEDFSKELTTTVIWLRDRDLDIRCIRLKPYMDGGRKLVNVQQIIPLPEASEYQIQIREKEQVVRKNRAERFDERLKFWQQLVAECHARKTRHGDRKPSSRYWLGAGAGKTGLNFNYLIASDEGMPVRINVPGLLMNPEPPPIARTIGLPSFLISGPIGEESKPPAFPKNGLIACPLPSRLSSRSISRNSHMQPAIFTVGGTGQTTFPLFQITVQ